MTTECDIDRWNSIASQYSRWVGVGAEIENDYTKIVTDAVLELLGEVRGQKVLDLGCGEGYLSRLLEERGALVEGIDGSIELVQLARKASRDGQARFTIGDIRTRLPYETGTFSRIVCNMVLMDLEEIDPVLREAARVLADAGLLVVSVAHPCFSSAVGDWAGLRTRQPYFTPRRRYIESYHVPKTFPGMESGAMVLNYHRPIQDYVKALLGTGLTLVALKETSFESDHAKPEHLRHHLTANNLILAARKGEKHG